MDEQSSDSEQLSPVLQAMRMKDPDGSPDVSPTQTRDPNKASECAVSWSMPMYPIDWPVPAELQHS